jgi:hypothetical protein
VATKIPGLYLRGAVYWYNYQIGGKRSHLSLQTRNISEAIEKITEIRANPLSGTKETIAAMIGSYTADKVRRNQFTDTTRRAVIISLDDLGAHCTRLPIGSVSTAHVQTWFNKGKAPVLGSHRSDPPEQGERLLSVVQGEGPCNAEPLRQRYLAK